MTRKDVRRLLIGNIDAEGHEPPANKRKEAAPTPAPAPAKRTRPHRSPQTPFEANEETVYAVDKIINVRWTKGSREYLVRWEGFAASHDTWEPMENLVGCAAQIREYGDA